MDTTYYILIILEKFLNKQNDSEFIYYLIKVLYFKGLIKNSQQAQFCNIIIRAYFMMLSW